MRISRWIPALAITTTFFACDGKEPSKVPLHASGKPNEGLVGETRVALDSGNVLFRAQAYDEALIQYERASDLAPSEPAPLLGILMVADKKMDSKLRQSAMSRLRRIDPSLADSSAATPHSKVMEGHPRMAPPASGSDARSEERPRS